MKHVALAVGVVLVFPAFGFAAGMTVDRLPIPGDPAFARVARDVLRVKIALDPSVASGAGLFEDAALAPSFSSPTVADLHGRLVQDMAALRGLPWRTRPVDEQIDFRWVYANAAEADHELTREKLYLHRPAQWLEPLANNFINLLTYAPQRVDLRRRIWPAIAPMVAEMRAVSRPTLRDAQTASGVIDGLLSMLNAEAKSPERDAALAALTSYQAELKGVKGAPSFSVIGAENYAWVLKNAELLPWSSERLLALAQSELSRVDARLAELKPRLKPAPKPTPEQIDQARNLTREKMLALYDRVVADDRAALDAAGVVTIPAGVGPIHARETPEAMVPLTGDGGSMNPPPTYWNSNAGWWNVEHFHADWTLDKRLEVVLEALNQREDGLGPYAAHEGVPGHHLQLSIARLNPDPIRSVLSDDVQNEGWALYAEDMFQKAGGLGPSVAAEYQMLDSWRFRVRRVFYDVNVESGWWTLQQAADFKDSVATPGAGKIDEDVSRAINWPAQLIAYFSGKMQILQLREDYKKKLGPAYTDRAFHDALLSVGSVPFVFARAKLLGEPVPGLDEGN